MTFRIGFALLAVGALADVGLHLLHGLAPTHTHGTGLGVATATHLIVAAGMLVTLGGLIHAAIRSVRALQLSKEAI